jgi:inosose dehydratase
MHRPLTRRSFLRSAAAGTAGLAASPLVAAQPIESGSYGPFKMGLQSYSLRNYPVGQALIETNRLGIRYWEAYPKHLPETADPEALSDMAQNLRAQGVRVLAYGVVPFTKDQAANRKHFEFAKAMSIPVLSADPSPDSFDHLDKLVEEFDIRIGIHNHGPGHRYDTLESVASAVKNHHKRIGVCVDTGHFLRSGVDPVKVIEALGDRVYGVHLKDFNQDTKKYVMLGKGNLNLVGVLKALKRLNYNQVMALEYEESPMNPIPEIQECLARVREAAKQI